MKERQKYSTLHYLQNKYGIDVGTKKFAHSMFMLSLLYKQTSNYSYYSYKKFVLNKIDPKVRYFMIV